jgi:oxygen-independent coproporphyrinogen-3 oxidase
MFDRLTLWEVNRVAERVSTSVSFSKVEHPEEVVPKGLGLTALNIRVPFCASRCPYCAFPGQLYSKSYAQVFLQGLSQEMGLYSSIFGNGSGSTTVDRVYLSGGTPTLLYKEFGTIQNHVSEHFSFKGKVALEASPADLSDDVLSSISELGISQLSIGVQSFNEGLLSKVLGRPAKRETLVNTLKRVMDHGFDYVNIDLMFSLPGQTREMLIEDLDTAAGIGVHGISTYPLMLLPYTALTVACSREQTKNRKDGEGRQGTTGKPAVQVDQSAEIEQYLAIMGFLRQRSYKFRTLWSFSLNPDAYEGPYEHDNFVGLGPRAWGVINSRFTLNSPSIEDYIATLRDGKLPLFAYSELRDYPVARLARRFYYGGIGRGELDELKRSDGSMNLLVWLLRLLGLVKYDKDYLRLTDKALAYGNIATKKIAMATLSKMDEILRAG